MEERSRGLELASCIISIAVGVLFVVLGITSLVAMGSSAFDAVVNETYEAMLEMGMNIGIDEFTSLFRSVFIMMVVIYFAGGAALITLSSFIIKRAKKLSTQKKLRSAYTIVTGIVAFMMLFGGITSDIILLLALAALIAAFVLENVFLRKNRPRRIVYITPQARGYGAPQAGSGMPDIFGNAPQGGNGMPDIFGEAEKKTDTLDRRIADLKKLHTEGVLTDEQYTQAVEKLIREESQK